MKILLIGPSKTGKSTLASFLAGALDSTTPAAEPAPTVGVRILEFAAAGAPVELWDVSGDQSYENTWPAVQKDADGVILCYAPEAPGHAVRPARSRRRSPARALLTAPPLFTRYFTLCLGAARAGAVLRVVLRQAGAGARALRLLCAVAVGRGGRGGGGGRPRRRAARDVSAARRRRRGRAARL